ncbi:DUF3043 domain-containing protein [Arsenicicoccus sp. MKL-02]|uniref:DUF3043 domain-containing protein n=1 Tax=Arsenicicoccus cauae TaxID=2663847 RepID=A0A6I3IWK2_9MICO|nr:DUF3043 domain-containing protein [Arsenicicoccus cauae]MTB72849.1 DUF3043 domain-containing protein [Arsenicicoccus cauae]
MLGRKKTEAATLEQLEEQAHQDRPGAKNRPTPKRREAEAARRRPLIETDRKAAAQRDRAASREERAKQQQAMMRGEEWALLPRDRGVARRYMRDYVDARWNIAEFTMPALIVAMVLSLLVGQFKNPALITAVMVLTYGVILLGIVEQTIVHYAMKRKFAATHPGEIWPPRAGFYSGMRAFQLRPTRVPRPQVKRGQHPR